MPVELPLLERAGAHSFTLLVQDGRTLIPAHKPAPGEQYRFHFDMSRCIGCKCCVVACNEQNGNPADLNWRRVGELEGGTYPAAQRWHLSMACNHCLEPSCMIGCPVEAYSKHVTTGIVDHDPDLCIGCQYCTWNCSYQVPQFNPARGVVGKCDMCHHRLDAGMAPACVHACPEGAIAVEIVNQAAWRADHAAANAPGVPSADDSFSTTRITRPVALEMVADAERVDMGRVAPDHPHWSLVGFLVATQLSVGTFLALWLLELSAAVLPRWAAIVPLAVAQVALAAAPLHLGRPAFAWRAIRNWKRSWLSREILLMGAFAGAATAYASALLLGLGLPLRLPLGFGAAAAGIIGVMASARIYMVKARPAWNLANTMIEFQLTGLVLGPRLVLAAGLTSAGWMMALAAAGTLAQAANVLLRARMMRRSGVVELRAAEKLLATTLVTPHRLRLVLSMLSLILVSPAVSFALALAGEIVGRYLFFTSVVPKSVASTFLKPKGAAAA